MHRPATSTFLVVFITISALFCQSINADTIYAWGTNDYGQLGLGTLQDPVREPTQVNFYSALSVASIQLSASFSFVTTTDGNVYTAGNNYYGCLGLNVTGTSNNTYSANFIQNPDLTNCVVTASKRHVNAVCGNTAYGWGLWSGNVIGATTGTWPKVHKATALVGMVGSVSVVEDGTFVNATNGVVFAAGNGTFGKLGLGDTVNRGKLVQVPTVPLKQIFSSQSYHICAVATNGSLLCWGNNDQGQLGLGSAAAFVTTPTVVQGIEDGEYWISQVAYGAEHTLVLTCGGAVLSWGSQQFGVLGDGVSANTSNPSVSVVQGLQGKSIVEIVTASNSNFARSSDGTWYTWGAGYGGILGTTSDVNVAVPAASPLLNNLGINRIVSGSSSRSAFGYTVQNVFNTVQCPGYTLVDECTAGTSNCATSNSICTDTDRSFKCSCEPGFSGDGVASADGGSDCTDIDECTLGTAQCDPNSACVNTVGSYLCDCNNDYHGNGYIPGMSVPNFSDPGQGCIMNVNECLNASQNDCSQFATCTDTVWAYNCSCNAGFVGDGVTCRDINECAVKVNPCGYNSVCTNTNGSYSCNCQSGFGSPDNINCTDVNECNSTSTPNPCDVNATCTNTIGAYVCSCNNGFNGNGTSCSPAGTTSTGSTTPTTGTVAPATTSVTNSSTTSGDQSTPSATPSTGNGTTGGAGTDAGSVTTGSGSTLGVQTLGQTSTIASSSSSSSTTGTGALSDLNATPTASDSGNDTEKKILVGVFVGFIGLVIVVVAVVVVVVVRRRRRANLWA